MRPISVIMGPYAAADAALLRAALAVPAAGPLVLTGSKLDKDRRIILTSSGNDAGVTFTVLGRNSAGAPIRELIPGANAGVAFSKQDFAWVDQVLASAPAAGTVSIGTQASTPVASRWCRMDDWAPGPLDVAVTVVGTISYNIEFSDDDPNGPMVPPLPENMTWFAGPAAVTNATTNQRITDPVTPAWVRILINSYTGNGAARFTVRQLGLAPL